ncbi:glycosyltransferase [Aromatoleum bremense]|uniref:Glycosyltransferase n=1 Tax=Aromatoleum bremense TaxID=76115 RepID=A0ABX1P0M3_9RHOO|nr:glycosyltransferase [Aromatoleum bremense]NMG17270.1 glycosyltransferase [Aromatoleum bremense]QTQ31320.1 Glycosyl transferase, family I [Aromatoleum bremense]
MRVALISDVYFPRVNGVSTSIDTFRTELARQGVDSVLIAPRYGAEPDLDDVIRLPARPVLRDPEDRLMSFRASLAQGEALRRRGVDLLHIQTPFVAHYAGIRLARQLGLPALATYHTLFEEYLHHYVPLLPRKLTGIVARGFSRAQCNMVDQVIAPSQAMQARLTAYGVRSPIEVLPTGIPIQAFAHGERRRFRLKLGIPEDQPVALFVGRVAHEKNIAFLIDVIEHARATLPRLLLMIAGEGPAEPSLRRSVEARGLSDAVRFIGYLDRAEDLPDCYAAADLFVFASRTETQGLVLLEAMAAGLPVLALACMGTRSILAPERGACIAPDVVAGFAQQLCRLLIDEVQRARLASEARVYAREWSDQTMASRLALLYRRLIETRSPN